jgi:prepilin-type N-terminal cleavage/methylation domain-containing protein
MNSKLHSNDRGFSLIELSVVLLVTSILMVIGMVSYVQMTRIADDKGVHLDLLTAVKVESFHHLETGAFTTDAGVLFGIEPTLQFTNNADPAGTVAVRVEAGRAGIDVCLFSQTPHGDWFSIYHSVEDGDRYGESAPTACTAGNVAGWTAESW